MNTPEVFRHKLFILNRDAKCSLEKGNDVENTERIHDTGFQKSSVVRDMTFSREREFCGDERPDLKSQCAIVA